jgi:chemosensory pili system protein ChpA (sensor histidine kinase/response regulator)
MSESDRSMEQTLLPAFLEEAAESVPLIRAAIAGACLAESAQAALQEAYRLVHNIRTSAAAVGEHALSDVARLIEDELDRRAYAGQPITPAEAERLSERLEAVEAGLLTAYDAVPAPGGTAVAPVVRAEWAEDDGEDAAAIPGELLEIFSSEAQDHLAVMSAALSRLAEAPDDGESLAEVRRSAHTLKGAAAMVGLRAISALAHRMEDLLGAIAEGAVQATPEVPRLLMAATDRLHAVVLGEAAPSTALPADLAARFDAMLGRPQAPIAHPSPGPARPRRRHAPAATHPERRRVAAVDRRSGGERRAGIQSVRVPVSRLDEIIGLQAEVIISRSAFERQVTELGRQVAQLDGSLDRLSRTWMRFEAESLAGGGPPMAARASAQIPPAATDAVGPHGFDELEFDRYTEWHVLSRQLTEAAADLVEGQRQLRETLAATERESTRLRRSTQDLQDRLMRLRMVPLSTLSTRLDRIVRVTAEEEGKSAAFVLEGGEVAIDKPLLDRLADPLFHLLRNAIDHGVESPADRVAAGKPERATVRVAARYEGSQALVEVSDDGAGLDHEAIRANARRSGRLSRRGAAAATAEELEDLVFETGFSTRTEVTEISGRGVGLDAVRAAVREVNGTIAVRTEAGLGTTFAIRLPLTLAIARVVMVRSGDETFAVPVTAIEQVIRVGADHLEGHGKTFSLRSDDGEEPRHAVWLADAVGGQPPAGPTATGGALLLKGGRRVALLVDELLDTREVVVRLLGRGLSGVPGLAGATVLADGRVVLILDAESLLAAVPATSRRRPERTAGTSRAGDQLRVLIVDDSVSVRHVLASLVARAGWAAVQARDGMEALDLLTADAPRPDVILSDIEMPRMDGFELTSAVRADPVLRETPIVLITSRSGEKHRARAFDLGVDDYLVKPFQESELIDLVGRLAGRITAGNRPAGREPPRPALPLPT